MMLGRRSNFIISVLLFVLSFGTVFYPASGADAAINLPVRDAAYSAKYVSQSIPDPVVMEAGSKTSVTFRFKNTGTAAWQSAGKRYISAYTNEPRKRTSPFRGPNWKSGEQTAAIAKAARPGETAEITIDLVAPEKTGEYTEYFHLSSEDYTWVKGGAFFLKITVVPASAKPPQPIAPPAPITRANTFMQNHRAVTAAGGEKVAMVLGFENVGETTWREYSVVANTPTALATAGKKLTFADDLWHSATVVVKTRRDVAPHQFIRQEFTFRAPERAGQYTATFQLSVDGRVREETTVNIPVTVTSDAPEHYTPPALPDGDAAAITPVYRFAEEPGIRVGLWQPNGAVEFVSAEDEYRAVSQGNVLAVIPKQAIAKLERAPGQYRLTIGEQTIESPEYIRLEPVANPHAVFRLHNFDRRVAWKGPRNFNTYRGAMEYRLTKKGDTAYVINDVLMEDYIAGIGETSNGAPMEYIKAILTAARTYAYYTKAYSAKHRDRYFDVVAHTGDQLYLGYESEKLMPRVAAAGRDTRGYMVTYGNEIVITPYYGNSDGRTRSWTEVWGGSAKPWLMSVPAQYDLKQGYKLWGHGVGMSAQDAASRADAEGADFIALLKYYYTGVEVARMYE